jgi:phosphatidylserine/phosphatidylglycerophosphate/cardiolipin synthase-like enzyme
VAILRAPASVGLVVDRDHYELVQRALDGARVSVWIGTANVKEMMVEAAVGTSARARNRYVSVLRTLEDLARRGVELRMLHASEPSRPFRQELARRPGLALPHLEMRQCPRVHLKMIAVDGSLLYLGSANFTGAGLGAKGDGRRNFELGIVTDDERLLDAAQARFDRIWAGGECAGCRLRAQCPSPLDAGSARAGRPSAGKPNAKGS